MHVLVVGASGATGRRVVGELRNKGHTVRTLVRRSSALLTTDVETHIGDVRDPSSLEGAARGVDACISALGTRRYYGSNGGRAVDAEGTRNLIGALVRARVYHVLLVSAFGLDRSSPFLTLFSGVFAGYYRWKEQAELAVRESGLAYTVVRPVELANRRPRGRACLNQSEPLSLLRTVSRDLVARVLVSSVGRSEAMGKTFEVFEGSGDAPDLGAQLRAMKPDGSWGPPPRTPLCR
jgi:uncharacterized protein YbjT (DUF2867 family)